MNSLHITNGHNLFIVRIKFRCNNNLPIVLHSVYSLKFIKLFIAIESY